MAETRLTRDLDEAMLGGVLAGLAERYDWDVTLVRIVVALLTVTTGVVPGVVAYLVAWVIVPPASEAESSDTSAVGDGVKAASEGAPAASAGGVADEMVAALRDAAVRLEEAGRIAAEAAERAATEIGEVVRRPREGGDEDVGTSEGAGAEGAATDGDESTVGERE